MNNKFDELTKQMAQSMTRRGALKKFGVGLAGMALACFGLANKAAAKPPGCLPTGTPCDPVKRAGSTQSCGFCCHGFSCGEVGCWCL